MQLAIESRILSTITFAIIISELFNVEPGQSIKIWAHQGGMVVLTQHCPWQNRASGR